MVEVRLRGYRDRAEEAAGWGKGEGGGEEEEKKEGERHEVGFHFAEWWGTLGGGLEVELVHQGGDA